MKNWLPSPLVLVLLSALVLSTGCSARSPAASRVVRGIPLAPNISCSTPDCTSYSVQPMVRMRSRYGTSCMGNTPPGTTPNPRPAPQSYLASDIGKPGFPKLRPDEARLVARIRRYIRSGDLRIAWLDRATTPNNFIVFDANDGPCEVQAGGYSVLNGGCNELYQPGENPYSTHAGSGCYPVKRPWMDRQLRGDRGRMPS
jgi:hypothetical protein